VSRCHHLSATKNAANYTLPVGRGKSVARDYVKVSLNNVLLQDLEQLAFRRQLTPQAYITDLVESHIAGIRLRSLKPPPGTGDALRLPESRSD
jgi:hypothetical protein